MLVHATRFIAVQGREYEQIQQEVSTMQTLLSFGAPATVHEYQQELQTLWDREITARHPAFEERLGDRCAPLPSWHDVWSEVPPSQPTICFRRGS